MRVLVWPWWLRLAHWSLAVAIVIALFTYHGGTVHETAGYTALVVAVFRLILGFVGPIEGRFSAFLRGPIATLTYVKQLIVSRAPRYLNHTPLGAWMIVALLAFALAGGASGAFYVTDRFWGEAWLIRVHAICTWIFVGLIPLHVGGVVHASWLHREHLIRAMLDGRKDEATNNVSDRT